MNSEVVYQEFGNSLQAAEESLVQIDYASKFPQGAEYRLPLFRLSEYHTDSFICTYNIYAHDVNIYMFFTSFITVTKILVEYEKGADSIYFPWLNSLPRQFYNGVSMTKVCFRCLPPYAGWLTQNERINCSHFTSALKQGYVPLSPETINNKAVCQWAYNCALTRFHEIWQPQRAKVIGPMADLLNHAAEPNCEITVDYEGNMNVVALFDIPSGSTMTISYGDPTNPTPLFAKYGFLPQDCTTIFCKAMQLQPQIEELGYDFTELLFQTETGEVAPKVWDIFLYDILQNNDYNASQLFRLACTSNDEGTKQQYHSEWYSYTLAALKEHVYSILSDAEKLTRKAQKMDLAKHPRVPVIVAHNQLVSQTFTMTAQLLESLG